MTNEGGETSQVLDPRVSPDGLAELLVQSRASPRMRSHILLHDGHHDPVQRPIIAAHPGTYVRPHVHSEQREMLAAMRGALDVLIFAQDGRLVGRRRLGARSPVIQIPQGVPHGCVIVEPDTLVLEVKPGPYRANEFLPGTPEEGTDAAKALLETFRTALNGTRLP